MIYSCQVDSTMLWNQQMGHISEKGIHSMHTKGMVEGITNFPETFVNIVYYHEAAITNKETVVL